MVKKKKKKKKRVREKKRDGSYVSIFCGGTSSVTWYHRYCVKASSHRLDDKLVQICDAVIDIPGTLKGQVDGKKFFLQ